MKQLSSFMVISIDGGDRISYTFDEIDEKTGEPISRNNKRNFFAVDQTVKSHVKAIRDFIRENKLEG